MVTVTGVEGVCDGARRVVWVWCVVYGGVRCFILTDG